MLQPELVGINQRMFDGLWVFGAKCDPQLEVPMLQVVLSLSRAEVVCGNLITHNRGASHEEYKICYALLYVFLS